MSTGQGAPNSIVWDCSRPCSLADNQHVIISTDYEGVPYFNGIVPSHRDASEVAMVIAEYLEDWGDEEVFYITPVDQIKGTDSLIKALRDEITEMARQAEEEKEGGEAGVSS